MSNTSERTFSVYDSEITSVHREFFEQIVRELMTIFPICSQGRSFADSIGNAEGASDQINIIEDLMQQAEVYGQELLDVSKNLFNKYYQARANYAKSIYANSAYITINLMDRNLLERTCDVRWWSLERAFGQCIEKANHVRDQLLQSNVPDVVNRVADLLTDRVRLGSLSQGAGAHHDLEQQLRDVQQACQFACSRLEDIRRSYTLYSDLVITTSDGIVIANANPNNRDTVLGKNVADETWFKRAMATADGNEYFAQDLTQSKLEDALSLIYSTAVRSNSEVKGQAIGGMGVLFDFDGESEIILNEPVLLNEQGIPEDGWFCFLTNEAGMVLQTTDPVAFAVGSSPYLPRSHRALGQGESAMSFITVHGNESAVFSAKTDGYLEYEGLGWSSHLILPKCYLFDSHQDQAQENVDLKELHASLILPEVNRDTYKKLTHDHQNIKRISLNGIIFASQMGRGGGCLTPVFDHITKTGNKVGAMMEAFLDQMAKSELESNMTALGKFSDQAINIVDRNLFERAADIRWWATDASFWEALGNPSPEAFQAASARLRVINDSYTMYRNLVLVDNSGAIVACSDANALGRISGINVAEHPWFVDAMKTTRSTEYAVQDVGHSDIEANKAVSLVYAGGVRRGGVQAGEVIGVLGIFFDWDVEAQAILQKCLPCDKAGEAIEGCCAFYTDAENRVIETTETELIPVGAVVDFPQEHLATLQAERAASGFHTINNTVYLIGSTRTKGYREYPGLNWSAHVIRPYRHVAHATTTEQGFTLNANAAPPSTAATAEPSVEPLREDGTIDLDRLSSSPSLPHLNF